MKINVLNNGQLHAKCDDLLTAVALVRTLECNINRALSHSPFTIEADVDSDEAVQERNERLEAAYA
jgi:hypothetical protein